MRAKGMMGAIERDERGGSRGRYWEDHTVQTEPVILGILPYDLPFAGLVMQVHRLSINVWGVLLHYFGLPFDNILGTGVFPDCINIRI